MYLKVKGRRTETLFILDKDINVYVLLKPDLDEKLINQLILKKPSQRVTIR